MRPPPRRSLPDRRRADAGHGLDPITVRQLPVLWSSEEYDLLRLCPFGSDTEPLVGRR
jgi:hypothetical protein